MFKVLTLVLAIALVGCEKAPQHHSVKHHTTMKTYIHTTKNDNGDDEVLYWYMYMINNSGVESVSYASSPRPVTNFSSLSFQTVRGGMSSLPSNVRSSVEESKEEPEQEIEVEQEVETEDMSQNDTAEESASGHEAETDSASDSSSDSGGGDGGGGD